MISIIAAVSENGVIGKDGKLPWHLPEDLKRFKEKTLGKAVVMGRKTWESLPSPLKDRRCIILSRSGEIEPKGEFILVRTVEDVLSLLEPETESFIIGGTEVFRAFLPYADRLYLTMINQHFEGDAHFPTWDRANFTIAHREERTGPPAYSFVELNRIQTV